MTTATASPPSLPLPALLLDSPPFLMLQLLRHGRRSAEATPQGPRLHQLCVLATLQEFGPQSQRDLARRLTMDPSDMVALIDALEADGLAVRERDPVDRRRHAVAITDSGAARVGELAQLMDERAAIVLPGLDAAERRQVVDLLRRAVLAADGGRA
jgi:DNA-binding MarR family transcriptional regulator